MKQKMSLGTRLFLSHLAVMVVGLSTFIVIAKVSSPQFFVVRLEQLERKGFLTVRSAKTYLIDGFQTAWNRSATWSLILGGLTAGGLSYYLSRRIMKPLKQIENITHNFAAGHWEQRIPESEIPELNQLSVSFNHMASSLEDVERRRRDLVGDLTHELRTPLTVVRGYLEELASGDIEASPQLYVNLIRETRRLENLTRDLQELSKAEAGYLSIDVKPINLLPLLRGLVTRFRDQLLDDGPVLKLSCPDSLPLVMADSDRTEQILVNLLGNAIRYTEIGSIEISTKVVNKYLWITVQDTGVGIAPEDLPHVFERFWRGDRSRNSYSGGSGIGLAITKKLVELQVGVIEVTSQLHQGTTFRFSLPLAKS
ncbi:sensor histidine kinase [Cyanobacterium sp. IPPAS B-1200]|uniref:sensor histidine kinase n=1 Tax=Cyanobacterium sp. IPPAS B-1200 TaxID=1562720 RepID=UPI00085262BC|nr:ATP-binding protein [Cyanobacterium sp. IPPAS B-1200]OEJ78940.1 two-component sensor histidine kinase [Cyanobacterium sp. IPPAS B-1200]